MIKCQKCGSVNINTERRPNGYHTCLKCNYKWKNIIYNPCVCCGAELPEGGHICFNCQEKHNIKNAFNDFVSVRFFTENSKSYRQLSFLPKAIAYKNISSCLHKIKNPYLQRFGLSLMDKIPDYFYTIPASSTGKYHPSFSQGEGGLVRHTLAAVEWYDRLCRAFNIEPQDEAVFALIFHDSFKSGKENSGHTVPEHPQLAADFIRKECPETVDFDIDLICRLILTHMGIWGEHKPETQLEQIVHLSDYCATQKVHERYSQPCPDYPICYCEGCEYSITNSDTAETVGDMKVVGCQLGKWGLRSRVKQ